MRTQPFKKDFDKNRNALIFGFTPQAELWNGRLAMVSLTVYFLKMLSHYGTPYNFCRFLCFFSSS